MSLSPERLQNLIDKVDKSLARAENSTIKRVTTALDSAYLQLEKQLLASYQKYQPEKSLLPAQRKLLIMQEISAYLTLLDPSRKAQIEQSFQELLRTSYESGMALGQTLITGIGNETVESFSAVPLNAIVFQAQESAARLSRWSEDLRPKISAIVEIGLATGDGPRKVAQNLRAQLGIVKGKAMTIARTESMASHNRALQQAYQDNNVGYVQLIATSDGRTCPYCGGRSGNVYRIGEIQLPLHPNDRCVLSPFKPEWQKLGLTNDKWHEEQKQQIVGELEKAGKAPSYGPAPFERASGQPAPTPVWRPGDSPINEPEQPKPVAPVEPKPQPVALTHKELIKSGRDRFAAVDAVLRQTSDPVRRFDVMEDFRQSLLKGNLSKANAVALAENLEADDEIFDLVDEQDWIDTVAEFYRMTNGKGSKSLKQLRLRDDRAWASDKGYINVGYYSTLDSQMQGLFHEMGHHVEYESKDLQKAVRDWVISRATGDQRPLRELTGDNGYRDDEMAYPDKFVDPYVGKLYEDGYTEVISMGMEHFYRAEDMDFLYSKDPEHFYLILGILGRD